MEQILKSINSFLNAEKIATAIIALIVCFIVIKIANKLVTAALEKSRLDVTLHRFIKSTVKILLYIVMVIIVSGTLGIEVSSLVALFSLVGLAVSLAVQDSLANATSGITILITKPFVKDDFVEIGGVSGTVDAVGIVNTTLRTPDNKMIFIPNNTISTSNIINYSHQQSRRVDITVSASYDSSTEDVKAALFEAAGMSADKILDEPPVFVALSKYGDSAIEYILRFWVSVGDYWDVYFKVMEDIRICFQKYNVEMTYNHIIVHKED